MSMIDNPLSVIAHATEQQVHTSNTDPAVLGSRESRQAIKTGGDNGSGVFVLYGLFDITPWDSFVLGDP